MNTKISVLAQRDMDANLYNQAMTLKSMREAFPANNVVVKGMTPLQRSLEDDYEIEMTKPFVFDGKSYNLGFAEDLPVLDQDVDEEEQGLEERQRTEFDLFTREYDMQSQSINDELDRLNASLLVIDDEIRELEDNVNSGALDNKTFVARKLQKGLEKKEIRANINQLRSQLDDITMQRNDFGPRFEQEKQATKARIVQKNKKIIGQFLDDYKMYSQGREPPPREDNESDEDYMARVRDNSVSIKNLPPEVAAARAQEFLSKWLRENFKSILKQNWEIEKILNSLSDEMKMLLKKSWPQFMAKLKELGAIFSKNFTSEDYIEIIEVFLNRDKYGSNSNEANKLLREIAENTKQNFETEESGFYPEPIEAAVTAATVKADVVITPLDTNETVKVEKDGFDPIYFKVVVGFTSKKPVAVWSTDNREETFIEWNNKQNGELQSVALRKSGFGSLELKKLFQISGSFTASNIAVGLTDAGLKIVAAKQFKSSQGSDLLGYGLTKSVEKYIPFGKVLLGVHKLHTNNVLSVLTPSKKSINGFLSTPVSERLSNLLLKISANKKVTHEDLAKLVTSEKILYDHLMHIAGIRDSIIPNTKSDTIEKIKMRFTILQGEIMAGNDNNQIKTEIKSILHKLHNFKVISNKQKLDYLAQL